MPVVTAILACLCGNPDDTYPVDTSPAATYPLDRKEAPAASITETLCPADSDLVSEILDILRNADECGQVLDTQVCDVIHPQGWNEDIAKAVLNGLERVITDGREKIGHAFREAIEAAEDAARACFGFSKEHPYLMAGFVTIVAIGVLVMMAPWAVEALGFGELGPIADTFAAMWQRAYAGFVPKGSLFSFLQRLGMIWSTTLRF